MLSCRQLKNRNAHAPSHSFDSGYKLHTHFFSFSSHCCCNVFSFAFPPWRHWIPTKSLGIVAFILILVCCIGHRFCHHRSHPCLPLFSSYCRFLQIRGALLNIFLCSPLFWTHVFVSPLFSSISFSLCVRLPSIFILLMD